MPLTLDQIIEEVSHWPKEQVTQLVDHLVATHHGADVVIEETWKAETRRRVAEIESGAVKGIPGEDVSARIRRLIGR